MYVCRCVCVDIAASTAGVSKLGVTWVTSTSGNNSQDFPWFSLVIGGQNLYHEMKKKIKLVVRILNPQLSIKTDTIA